MAAASNWKKAGLLLLGLHASMLLVRACGEHRRVKMQRLLEKDAASELRKGSGIKTLVIEGCSLEELPPALGQILPEDLQILYLGLVSAPGAFLSAEKRRAVTSCAQIKSLTIMSRVESPETFKWIKLFFPALQKMTISVALLPAQGGACIGSEQLEGLVMRNVTDLLLVGEDSAEKQCPVAEDLESLPVPKCLIFENLKLFPALKRLEFGALSTIHLDYTKEVGLTFPLVTHLDSKWVFASLEFLGKAPEAFPELRELWATSEAVRAMTHDNKASGTCVPCYASLEKLGIIFSRKLPQGTVADPPARPKSLSENETLREDPSETTKPDAPEGAKFPKARSRTRPASISIITLSAKLAPFFGPEAARVFPHLKSVEINSPDDTAFPYDRQSTIEIPTVTTVVISGSFIGQQLEAVLQLFPKVESLAMTRCNLQALFGRSPAPVSLTRLDVSKNSGLNSLLQRSETDPAGGLVAPNLEVLDVRDSFFAKIPRSFFAGCPKIKELSVTFDLRHGDKTPEWWDFLEPLKELKALDVELGPYCLGSRIPGLEEKEKGCQAGSSFEEIARELAQILTSTAMSLESRPHVRIFRPRCSVPVEEIELPGIIRLEQPRRIGLSSAEQPEDEKTENSQAKE